MAKNIAREVWGFIEREPSLKLDLSRELINVRALARLIAKESKLHSTEDAIISAIRRYPLEGTISGMQKAIEVARQSRISTRSKIVNVALLKDREIQEQLSELFSLINFDRGEILRLVQGEESIKVMVDERNLEKVLDVFPKRKILHIHKNLAEINLRLHPQAVNTPGTILVFCTELARNGVNMVEIMSCVPELLIFVEERDLLKAYETFFNLFNKGK